jgi:hypothetical protein
VSTPANPVNATQGTQQYLREFSLVVSNSSGGFLDLSALRCTFTVKRGDIQTPNSLDVKVWNPGQNTAQRLNGTEFTTITAKAGYTGNFAQIFTGSIKQVRIGRANAVDSYLDITAADSDELYNFAPISMTLTNAYAGSVIDQIRAPSTLCASG